MQTAMNTRDQNSHIFAGMIAQEHCFDWLMDNGFSVLKSTVGEHAMPVIHIQTSGKCNLLKERHNAACYGFRGENGGRVNTWRADVLGCRVEWTERGH